MPPRKQKKGGGPAVGLDAVEVGSGAPPAEVAALAAHIAADGGTALCAYRDPYGGKWLILAALPIAKVAPTPYQRELSEAHAERLAAVIPKVGRFLDPVIATRHDGGYWTPNGMHRLVALQRLGGRSIVALVVPEPEVAFRILALNTEKAHNLKDKSLEAVRMARGLAAAPDTAKRPEADWAFELEEPAYLTIGMCYEQKPRFSGGAYHSIVKRCEEFADRPIARSLPEREARARRLLALDEAVVELVDKLKKAGLRSPYLKPFVVARLNPLRWGEKPRPGKKAARADFDKVVDRMLEAARKFDATKVRPQDLATAAGGAPAEAE